MILGRGYFINFDDLSSILDFTLVLTKVPWLRPLVCPAIIHHNLIDNYQMCMKIVNLKCDEWLYLHLIHQGADEFEGRRT